MLTTFPALSKAKLCGAVIALPFVVQSEVSSSAMNASLNWVPTNSGNSSEKNLKSTVRQFDAAGTSRLIARTVTSKSVSPRECGPSKRLPPLKSNPESPAMLASSANCALPVVRIANVDPLVGKPPSGAFATALGVTPGGAGLSKLAPVTRAGFADSAAASDAAPAESFVTGTIAA